MLLTKVFRMLIARRSFNRAKRGTVRYQALLRGYNLRRVLAAIEVEKYFRRYAAHKRFVKLKSSVLALQCATRSRTAIKILTELKKEQKDVGKLKANNEKLKEEMASLRAMLAAQAKESAAGEAHSRELEEKEKRIAELEKKIADIEKELEAAKKLVEKLEADIARQLEESKLDKEQLKNLQHRQRRSQPQAPDSPVARHKRRTSSSGSMPQIPLPEGIPADYVSPDVLAEHRARVATLEEELEAERRVRREADGEIIKLRAAINGVKLNEEDVKALLSPQVGMRSEPFSEESSFADSEDVSKARYVAQLVALLVWFRRCADCVQLVLLLTSCNFMAGPTLFFLRCAMRIVETDSALSFERIFRTSGGGAWRLLWGQHSPVVVHTLLILASARFQLHFLLQQVHSRRVASSGSRLLLCCHDLSSTKLCSSLTAPTRRRSQAFDCLFVGQPHDRCSVGDD